MLRQKRRDAERGAGAAGQALTGGWRLFAPLLHTSMALSLVKLVHLLAWVMLVVSSIQKSRLISAQALDESAVLRLRRWDKV